MIRSTMQDYPLTIRAIMRHGAADRIIIVDDTLVPLLAKIYHHDPAQEKFHDCSAPATRPAT